MVQLCKLLAIAAACLAAPAIAHPGEKHDPHILKREIHTRDVMAAAGKRSLGGCESTLHARELAMRNVARRARTVQKLRQKRGITSGRSYHKQRMTSDILPGILTHHSPPEVPSQPCRPGKVGGK